MGTKQASLIADIVLYSYDPSLCPNSMKIPFNQIQQINLNNTYRYLDDILAIYNPDLFQYVTTNLTI